MRGSPPPTRSRTKARPAGHPHRAKRLHRGRLSPSHPTPNKASPGTTQESWVEGLLRDREPKPPPPRSPEQPFQNLSVQYTRGEKPDHFESLIFYIKLPVLLAWLAAKRPRKRGGPSSG